NIYLGRQPKKFRITDWRAMRDSGRDAMRKLNIDIDVTRPLGSFSIAVQQLVAIARALETTAKVLVLDEPTSSLDAGEVARLFDLMRDLKRRGIGIIFITHFLE